MFYNKDFVEWHRWGFFLAAIFYLQVDSSRCQVIITSQPPEPKVGETVILRFQYEGKIQMVNWYRGTAILDSQNIVTYNPTDHLSFTTGNQFNNKMKVLDDKSLQISNLAASDIGDYTLQITIPGSHLVTTFPLTVRANAQSPPLTPTGSPPNQGIGGNTSTLIGIIIGSVCAVILVVAVAVIWYKRGCNKTKPNPVFINEGTTVSSPSEDISSKLQINFNRRLPSIPPRPTIYQNEINNSLNEDKEHPYTDLNYPYLNDTYLDLQSYKN